MKPSLAISLTGLACLMLFYFVYGLVWFVLVRRQQGRREKVFAGIGFLAVMLAMALSVVLPERFALRRLVLFTNVGSCVTAIVVAKFGSRRTALPIVAGAFVVALNAVGTLYGD